jgi:ribosome-binding protein aMBF1 (putative translation factor)
MTSDRLRHCLSLIGWSQRQLARVLDQHEGTVRQWARGTLEIPEDIATWLERLAAAHEANPVPRKSKTFNEATDEEKEVGSGSIWERPF